VNILLEVLNESQHQAGDIIFHEGTTSEVLFLVFEGEVEIIKSLGTNDERLVAKRGRGSLLGEMSMFSANGTHTASVRALTTVRLLDIVRDQFHDLLQRHPEIALDLLGLMSRRLEESENTTIQDLREKNSQLTLAYQELKAAQDQLIEKKKLERELEIASKLQASILPQRVPKVPGLDIGVLIAPAHLVGGDFYDFIPLGPGRLGIVVGDVCDKGIPAALFMTLTYALMRDEAFRHRRPGNALRAVNRRLVEINPTGKFVTLLYGILDSSNHTFNYARAGHPHPLILDSNLIPIPHPSSPGQPVGLFEDFFLDEQCVSIQPDSTLIIYSDGLNAVQYSLSCQDRGRC
jgi:serine phosphatase RsbU (regulator of sigma subunit)